jgi:hypothetical protein
MENNMQTNFFAPSINQLLHARVLTQKKGSQHVSVEAKSFFELLHSSTWLVENFLTPQQTQSVKVRFVIPFANFSLLFRLLSIEWLTLNYS